MALGLKRYAPKGWAQLRHPPLPERAAEIMRSAILVGRLKRGQRLIEYTLASDLRIGQPTLREALKRLEYEGFVHKIPKKGTYVVHLTKEDCRKMLEVLTPLELLAVTMATRNVDVQGKTELEGAAAMMECAASNLDYRA